MLGVGLGLWQAALRGGGFDPLAPGACTLDLHAASDSGSSATDNITNDTTPRFDITLPSGFGDARDAAADDVLVLHVSDHASFSSDEPETLDAGDVAGGVVALTPSELPNATFYARARLERGLHIGPWSSVLTFVVDTGAPTITTSSTANCAEGVQLAIVLGADELVAWTITGGADQTKFEISGARLRWASDGTKNFESPDDADTDNAYVVQVTATDPAGNATNKTITVTVTDVDDTAPTITSASSINNTSGAQLAHSLTANEPVSWSITGGTDQAQFELSGSTLRWLSNGTHDFGVPQDADANNDYVVQVTATDLASNFTDQLITVTVVSGADALLLETGDHLLLETGDKLLLE